MLRGFRAAFRPFTDDRGHRCGIAWQWELPPDREHPKHWDRLCEPRQDLRVLPVLALHMPTLVFLQSVGWTGWTSYVVAALVEIPILWCVGPLLTRPMFYPFSHIYRHQLVALRCCAACGYDLAGLPGSPDGYFDCPECRAGWRADRLGAEPDRSDSATRRRKLREKSDTLLRLSGATATHDDRAQPAELVIFRRCPGVLSDYSTQCRNASDDIIGHQSDKAQAAMIACFLGAAAILIAAIGVHSALGYTPWWAWCAVALMVALIASGFAIGLSDLAIGPEVVKRATLHQGLCPSCWEPLRAREPGEDGCTACLECGSAWVVPDPTPEPTLSRRTVPVRTGAGTL